MSVSTRQLRYKLNGQKVKTFHYSNPATTHGSDWHLALNK